MKLFLQPNGSQWSVGMQSDNPKEIERQVWSFFTHGAIESVEDVTHLSESFSYIWTDKERLEKYFLRSSHAIVMNETEGEEASPALHPMVKGVRLAHKIKALAKERMEKLLANTDRWWRPRDPSDVHQLGTVKAENLDSDS